MPTVRRDWRDADPSDTRVLYAREQEYWVRELAWDASTAWREIEQARVTWGLPGFLAIDTDRTVRGWAYFLPEGETVHLGGVVAETREATGKLLDACLESALRPPRPARVSCFLPMRAEGFEELLRERGFVCEHYRYLSRPIAKGEEATEAERWNAGDLLPAAALLRDAYGVEGKHFAPRGTPEEWEQYVRSLVERPGCGVIEPTVTRVVRNGDERCRRSCSRRALRRALCICRKSPFIRPGVARGSPNVSSRKPAGRPPRAA